MLLPGSRKSELQRHLPVMLDALKLIQEKLPAAKAKMVLPNPSLVQLAKSLGATMEIQIGELPWALAEADVAIASTGTVTMECAFFGVPTVTLYKTSWLTYQIAKRIITVKSLTMPNLLAGETVYPEFVQNDATPENISQRRAGIVAGRIAPGENQSATRENHCLAGRTRRGRTRGGGGFKFVPMKFHSMT